MMSQTIKRMKKPKRRRGRPAKKVIKPIEAGPKEIAQALARAAERKGEKRRLNKV